MKFFRFLKQNKIGILFVEDKYYGDGKKNLLPLKLTCLSLNIESISIILYIDGEKTNMEREENN